MMRAPRVFRTSKGHPSEVVELPDWFKMGYDRVEYVPADSPMIRMLDGEGWRESLVIAHVLADETLWHDSRRPNFDFDYDLGPAEHLGGGMYASKVIWRKSEMIRLLDDPAWRESLKVAETPLTTSGTFTLFTDGTGRYFDYAGNEVKLSRT